MAKILDGKILAQQIKAELKGEVAGLKKETGRVPRIVNTIIGDDHGSCAYANSQQRLAQQLGIDYQLVTLPGNTTQDKLREHITKLNADPNVNGIMIHKPVPDQIDYHEIANCVDIRKDLEGVNVANIGKMVLGETKIIPCTPAAVMEHLKAAKVPLRGKEAVVVGASDIVGKPLSLLLLREFATVTVCHIATSEAGKLQEHIAPADIVVVAVGKAHLVKGDWIKPGAVVIDVGINLLDGKTVGDVDFESAKDKAGMITPVPGGVGPVTVCMLMRNGIEAFKMQN